jgi:hypothetical protein
MIVRMQYLLHVCKHKIYSTSRAFVATKYVQHVCMDYVYMWKHVVRNKILHTEGWMPTPPCTISIQRQVAAYIDFYASM